MSNGGKRVTTKEIAVRLEHLEALQVNLEDLAKNTVQSTQNIARSTEDLRSELLRIAKETAQLDKKFAEKLADTLIQEKAGEIEAKLQKQILEKVKLTRLTVGAIATVLAVIGTIVGVLGVKYLIPDIAKNVVDAYVGQENKKQFEELHANGQANLKEIKNTLREARKEHGKLPLNRTIVLQTDFGEGSPDMTLLKAAILQFNQKARILNFNAEKFDVRDAARKLYGVSNHFPVNTVFVSIVKPEIPNYKTIVTVTEKDHIFIGYDNGTFDYAVNLEGHRTTYFVEGGVFKQVLKDLSKKDSDRYPPPLAKELTGGIDVIGPLAGLISLGDSPWETRKDGVPWQAKNLVQQNSVYQRTFDEKMFPNVSNMQKGVIKAMIVDIDEFGNAQTNVSLADLKEMFDEQEESELYEKEIFVDKFSKGSDTRASCNTGAKTMQVKDDYKDVGKGEPVAVVKESAVPSGKFVRFAINQGNFSEKENYDRGQTILVCANMP